MRPSTRFDILTRDGFACRYCGATAPDAELHVDHVVSRRDGGTDAEMNLATACTRCNLGKSARSITDTRVSRRAMEALIKMLFLMQDDALEYLKKFIVQHHCGCALEDEVADYIARMDDEEERDARIYVVEIAMRCK